MAIQTLIKKTSIHPRGAKIPDVLQRMRAWRMTVGARLHGWNEVKTIRQWRDKK